jgi:hypothetical protein
MTYPRYTLIRDFETPVETIKKGTTREVIDWMNTFPGLSDFSEKPGRYKNWFVEEEKTERIKVNIGTLDSGGDRGRPHEYPLVTSHPIPVEKIPLLREAIENVLNSISQPNIPNK